MANTSQENRRFLRGLPNQLRFELGNLRVLLCHGSPRKVNEFLWESTTPTHFLNALADEHQADVIAATHTGIKWRRALSDGKHFVNVGVIGRPENDGCTNVWYTLLEADQGKTHHVETPEGGAPAAIDVPEEDHENELGVTFVPARYDHERLAAQMREEGLPEEFVETILTGWWTTCLEILPAKERKAGRV